MTFVVHPKTRKAPAEPVTEPPLTLPFWAEMIEVISSDDWLVIQGIAPAWEPVSSAFTTENLLDLRDFAPPFKARTSADWEQLSRPAMDFIDAKTDERLVG